MHDYFIVEYNPTTEQFHYNTLREHILVNLERAIGESQAEDWMIISIIKDPKDLNEAVDRFKEFLEEYKETGVKNIKKISLPHTDAFSVVDVEDLTD